MSVATAGCVIYRNGELVGMMSTQELTQDFSDAFNRASMLDDASVNAANAELVRLRAMLSAIADLAGPQYPFDALYNANRRLEFIHAGCLEALKK